MLCFSSFELYSRCVPLETVLNELSFTLYDALNQYMSTLRTPMLCFHHETKCLSGICIASD